MRHRLAVLILLLLFGLLPVLHLLAAPVPDPSAILDIGPPAKGVTAEEHCKDVMYSLTKHHGFIWYAGMQPSVGTLPSVARLKDGFHPWLEENIRATPEDGGRRLRLTFRAGTRAEQVTILNALLSVYFREGVTRGIKLNEEQLQWEEKGIVELEKRIESGHYRERVDRYTKGINNLRTNIIPARRAEIARLKEVAVIKWAK